MPERPTCLTCPYYDGAAVYSFWATSPGSYGLPAARSKFGVCRFKHDNQPQRDLDEWCGEHPQFGEYRKAVVAEEQAKRDQEWRKSQPPYVPPPPLIPQDIVDAANEQKRRKECSARWTDVYSHASKIFGSLDDALLKWQSNRHERLGNRTPWDACWQGDHQVVIDHLNAIAALLNK